MLNVVMLDDNPAWLLHESDALLSYAHAKNVELSLNTYSSREEFHARQQVAPDVLFTDIELGESGSGIELVKEANRTWPSCQIVYVTNYLRYAPEVYVTDHLWYVLKEDFERRLPEIMDKLASQLDDEGAVLAVKTTSRQLVSIRCMDVISIERRGRVTRLAMADGSVHTVPDKVMDLLNMMPKGMFSRCHGSYAVNLAHVKLIDQGGAVLDGGSEVPVSRRFAPSLRNDYLAWVDRHAV